MKSSHLTLVTKNMLQNVDSLCSLSFDRELDGFSFVVTVDEAVWFQALFKMFFHIIQVKL